MFKCESFNQIPNKIAILMNIYIPFKASRKCIYIFWLLGGSPEQADSLIGSGSGFSVYLDWSFTILLKPNWDSDHVIVFLLKLKPAQHGLGHYLV
jgi:hypothetical protein